jgi:hypothetical protein
VRVPSWLLPAALIVLALLVLPSSASAHRLSKAKANSIARETVNRFWKNHDDWAESKRFKGCRRKGPHGFACRGTVSGSYTQVDGSTWDRRCKLDIDVLLRSVHGFDFIVNQPFVKCTNSPPF